MRKVILSLLVALSVALTATAQDRVITGRVVNDKDVPLEGISVSTPDGKFGTKTSTAGTYSIKVPATQKSLVFTGVNFEKTTMAIGSSSVVNSQMAGSSSSLWYTEAGSYYGFSSPGYLGRQTNQ